jgi:hypothetical protein
MAALGDVIIACAVGLVAIAVLSLVITKTPATPQRRRLDSHLQSVRFGSARGLFVPNPSVSADCQRRSTLGVRQAVRGCRLTSTVGGGDCHSVGHSVACA